MAQWAPILTVPANVLCTIVLVASSLPDRVAAVLVEEGEERKGERRNCWQLSAMTKCANRFIGKCWSVHEQSAGQPTSTSGAIAIRRAFPVTGLCRLQWWLLARSLSSDFDFPSSQPSPLLALSKGQWHRSHSLAPPHRTPT